MTRPGIDQVHRDVVFALLQSEVTRHERARALADGVGERAIGPDPGIISTQTDNPAPGLLAHERQACAGTQEGAKCLGLDDITERLRVGIGNITWQPRATGVVDEDIDTPKGLLRLADHLLDLTGLARVSLDEARTTSHSIDRLDNRLCRSVGFAIATMCAVVEHDVGAVSSQRQGDAPPHAPTRRPGNQGHASLKESIY